MACGHTNEGVVKSKPCKYLLLQQVAKIPVQRSRSQVAEKTDAWVGIAPYLPRDRVGFPRGQVRQGFIIRGNAVGELERQPASRVRRQMRQGGLVDGRSGKFGNIARRRVREGELSLCQGISAECRGESLTHRTEFENGVLGHRNSTLKRGDTIVEEVMLPTDGYCHSEAGNIMLFNEGRDGATDRLRQLIAIGRIGRDWEEGEARREYQFERVTHQLAFLR